jgi:hypothetical protein
VGYGFINDNHLVSTCHACKQQRKSTLEVISNDVMLDLCFSLSYLFFD